MACSAFAFFFKHVFPAPYVLPSELYPRKEFRLPDILSVEQFSLLYGSITNIKHKAIIGMLYGTGMRPGELRYLQMRQIDRKNHQVKIIAGKGNKDRFTLLPKTILQELETYYRNTNPKHTFLKGRLPDSQ
jgi:integrase/recombinase XerD